MPRREDRSVALHARPHDSDIAPRWLVGLTRYAAESPRATLVWSLVVASLCIAFGVRFLQLEPSRDALIDPSSAFHQRWLDYTAEFGNASEIVVVVRGDDAGGVANAARAIASDLKRSKLVSDVLSEVDWSELERRSIQYLGESQLSQLDETLQQDVLPCVTGGAGIAPIAGRLTSQLQQAADRGDATQWSAAIDRTRRFAGGLEAFLSGDVQFSTFALPTNSRGFPQPGSFHDGRLRVVSCYPTTTSGLQGSADAVQFVREVSTRVATDHPDISVGVTGVPVLEFDEMDRSSRDMALASSVSAVGVAVLLCIGFRGSRIPRIAVIVLGLSMAWAVGWVGLSVGRLNILSVSFAAILIGLGVDFTLHWLAHFEDDQGSRGFRNESAAANSGLAARCVQAAGKCGTGIATAAVTTASAFFVAGLTPFRGLAELGIIAGGGVLLCAAGALVLTPALAAIGRQRSTGASTPAYAKWLADHVSTFGARWLALSVSLVAVAFVLAVDVSSWTPRVMYDANLLSMQPENLPSVSAQAELESATPGGLLFAVSRASSVDEAVALNASLEQVPEVGSVMSLAQVMPSEKLVGNREGFVRSIAARLRTPVSARVAPSDGSDAVAALGQLATAVQLSDAPDAIAVSQRLRQIATQLRALPTPESTAVTEAYARWVAEQGMAVVSKLRQITEESPITKSLLPPSLSRRFVGANGTWLVLTFPSTPIWNATPLEGFVEAVRRVDPEVTGTPIQNYEATRQIRASYVNACVYALTAVFLILYLDASTPINLALVVAGGGGIAAFAHWCHIGTAWQNSLAGWCLVFTAGASIAAVAFDFRGAARAFGAAMPSIFGGVLTAATLATLGVDFNPANLIVLPLILGIGVDDGVHILHGMRSGAGRIPPATIHALTMTSLTSVIGFGSLVVSDHRGLASLGTTLVIGVSACYIVSIFTLLPAASLFRRRGSASGEAILQVEPVDTRGPMMRDAS